MNAFIDLDKVKELEGFSLKEKDGLVLINPEKTKGKWKEDDPRYLRSALVKENTGELVSLGFYKFVNFGETEWGDSAFRAAVSHPMTSITFLDKVDGSLIIVDMIDRRLHMRTRGSHTLGEFEDPIEGLIRFRYPEFKQLLASSLEPNVSLLFEYIGPNNKIVLNYPEPELVYLGAMNKQTLDLVPDMVSVNISNILRNAFGIRGPDRLRLGTCKTPEEIAERIRPLKDTEGIVALWRDGNNLSHMIKIKTEEYIKLHSLKFHLENKIDQLCFLLNLTSMDEVEEAVEKVGIDYEFAMCFKHDFEDYFEKLDKVNLHWPTFVDMLSSFREKYSEDRKQYVSFVKAIQNQRPEFSGQSWFGAAMKLFDGKRKEAMIQVLAGEVLNKPVVTVSNWTVEELLGANRSVESIEKEA